MKYPLLKGKKVLITGGLGFLGSNCAISCAESGADVTVIDNYLEDHGANDFNLKPVEDCVEKIVADIRDGEKISKVVRDKDIIINLAAQTSHTESMKFPLKDLDINCRGNLIFLDACARNNPDAKIVYIGTRAFYGKPRNIPASENENIDPIDFYGLHRYCAERYHFLYSSMYGIRCTSARLANLYGPRAQMKHAKYGIVNWFIRLSLEGQPINIYGDGQQLRDYLYVDDAVDAIIKLALEPSTTGKYYNIGSGTGIPLIEITKKIISAGGGKSTINFIEWPTISKQIETGDFIADITTIKKDISWEPRTSIDEGVSITTEYYKKYAKYYW